MMYAKNRFFTAALVALALSHLWACDTPADAETLPQNVSILIDSSDDGNKTEDLRYPAGIDFDSRGNAVIVELSGGRVLRVDPSGKHSVLAGTENGGFAGRRGTSKESPLQPPAQRGNRP